MQMKESTDKFDVIIVGSGAGGGMATKILSEAGLNVGVVEAGPYFDPASQKDMTQLKPTWESPRRGARTTRAFGDFDAAYGGWEIKEEPYTRAPGTKFDWFRSRMLGGRTNHWGRISLRFGPLDFIVKDMPEHQVPIRGGVMWLDGFSNKLYNKEFINCSDQEQITMCDQIAYPKKTKSALKPGEHFFTRMRQLTLTGYFTSKMGIEELGYKGNTPNVWDGIPGRYSQGLFG